MGKLTNFPNGISSMGVDLPGGRAFGKNYFVNGNTGKGSDGNTGLSPSAAFKTVTNAFATVKHYDTIFLAGGGFTGHFTTGTNAAAAFVHVRGFKTGDYGHSTWMNADSSSSPIIDVISRGWTFSDIEFACPTGAAAIRLSEVLADSSRADYTTIENCNFETGKYGIQGNGGSVHVTIRQCKFEQLTTSGAFAIISSDNSVQIPSFWVVEDCIFATSVNHIGPSNNQQGWSDSTFRRNIHQGDGVSQDVTTILDVRANGGGGNIIIDNYFDMAEASFQDNGNLTGNATDYAAGNFFADVSQTSTLLS